MSVELALNLITLALIAVLLWRSFRPFQFRVKLPNEAEPFAFAPRLLEMAQSADVEPQAQAALKMDYAVLRAELANDPTGKGYAALGQDYGAIAKLLNDVPMIPNPTPCDNVPKRWTLADFLAAPTAQETISILQLPALIPYIDNAVSSNDRTAMAKLLNLIAPMLSAQSRANVQAMLDATEPDPTWQATIAGVSRAAELGLSMVRNEDVQAIDNGIYG